MLQVFQSLFSSLGSFASSPDLLFGFVFCSIGVLGLLTGLFRFLKI